MPRVAGIVAEFNPFHNGHAALVHSAKDAGCEAVVAVLSGNFVQRAAPAIAEKRVRTKMALLCGVDLVLELPLPYATATAQLFSRGAVSILAATGCVDSLWFGSESGDVAPLQKLAHAQSLPEYDDFVREYLSSGITFAKARQQALSQLVDESTAQLLESPNNALAIEYIHAAKLLGWTPELRTIPRKGVDHDSDQTAGKYASASFIRSHTSDVATVSRHIPPTAAKILANAATDCLYPADAKKLETAILSYLRRLQPDDFLKLPDCSEGLENRLFQAVQSSTTLDELEQNVKTKRYTLARVRRLILAAFLGIYEDDATSPPPYIRVLGCTEKGRGVLSQMKTTATIPFSHSLSKLRECGDTARRFAQLEAASTDQYSLCLPKPLPCGYDYTASAIFLKQ